MRNHIHTEYVLYSLLSYRLVDRCVLENLNKITRSKYVMNNVHMMELGVHRIQEREREGKSDRKQYSIFLLYIVFYEENKRNGRREGKRTSSSILYTRITHRKTLIKEMGRRKRGDTRT